MNNLKHLNKYFYKYRYRFISGIFFIILTNIFAVYPAQVIRYALNMVLENIAIYRLFDGSEFQSIIYKYFSYGLLLFGAAVLGLALVRGLFMYLMRQTIIVMSRLIEFDLRNEIYIHYQLLGRAFYKKNKTGDLMSRITEDVSRVRMYLGPAVMYSINLVTLFIIVIYMMLKVNVELTIYVLLPMPLLSFSIYYISDKINKRSEQIQQRLSGLTSLAQESFSGIRVIKSFVQESSMIHYFSEENEAYKKDALKLARIEALFFPLMLLLIGLSTILTVFLGGLKVISGDITAGNIAEFVIYINMLTWPIASIGWVASLIQRADASQKRINEFLNTKPDVISEKALSVEIDGNIVFEKVSFIYPDSGIQALEDINFKINAGQKVAVIGRTGSGKSTIADLLLRMYDVTSGNIQLSGQNIKDISLKKLRSQIGYVPQDIFLFSDTIRNNIAFGLKEKDLITQQIIAAAQDASVDNDIISLPKGFDTMIGERGVTLSGGQKQRVSIARALIKDPRLLILDDCLSAVDSKTEKNILLNLQKIWKEKTVLVITHRIFSLLYFDNIIVLDNGRIAEQGKHRELLERKGMYYELYQRQQAEEYIN